MKPVKIAVSHERTVFEEPYKPIKFTAYAEIVINEDGDDPVTIEKAIADAFPVVVDSVWGAIAKNAPSALPFEQLENLRKGMPAKSKLSTDLP